VGSSVVLCPRNSPGYEGSGFPIDFTIKTVLENGGWITQVARTGYAKPDHVCTPFSFNATTASRVRIEGTTLRQIWGEYRMPFAEVVLSTLRGGSSEARRVVTTAVQSW
jgi:hypothetical protein